MKIADICVQRPVFAVMLIAFLVTLGIFSFRSLGVDCRKSSRSQSDYGVCIRGGRQ